MRRTGAQVVLWVSAAVLGTWCVLEIDAVAIVARGGPLSVLLSAHVLAMLGAVVGLALWAAGRALWAVGCALERQSARFGARPLSPLVPLVFGGAAVGTYLLAPAHRVFSFHPATTALLLAYLPFPLALIFTIGARLFRSGRLRGLVALGALLGVGVLHRVNSWYYPGLYRPVHDALTGVAIALGIAGAAFVLEPVAPRTLIRCWVPMFGVSLLAAGLGALAAPQRAVAVFDGTELGHVLSWIKQPFDRDGDGFASGIGGDCDDARRGVNPLAIEQPANGVDENCRLGDRDTRGVAESERVSPRPKQLDAWQRAHPKPNIVVLMIDTLRADFVGALGSKRALTPNLDAWASSAVVFEQARTTAPRTSFALASLARARFHGRTLECRRWMTSGTASLAALLKTHGYDLAIRMVGDNWAGTPATVDWPGLVGRGSLYAITSPSVTADALALLQQLPHPFFLFAHYLDLHAPYELHPGVPRRGSGIAAAYGGELEAIDREIGKLRDQLRAGGRLADTIVVVMADHGENLGERGSRGGHHGVSLYEEDVHVPLIIWAPGIQPRRVAAPVSIVDIAPTLLELTGAEPLPEADGRSLAGYLLGEPPPETWTLSELYEKPSALRAIVDGHFKLIHDVADDAFRLYDLATDPGERVDIAAAQPKRVATLFGKLDRWIETRADASEPHAAQCLPARAIAAAPDPTEP